MASEGIFLLRDDKLHMLEAKGFEAEDVLQRALAEHPEVIAGQATVGGAGGRLLLIAREVGVPISDSSGDWFSADHVFIDSAGVPVIVETKRSSDTRSRREVVAQLLDYAANGTKYWSVERMQEALSQRAEQAGTTTEDFLASFDSQFDVDSFWQHVEANLSQGRVRLVIVADRLAPELQRLIEFLNEQLLRTELIGVELRHFTDGDQRALVPRVVGVTNRAADAKEQGHTWDEASFMQAAGLRAPKVVGVLEKLFQHVTDQKGHLSFGKAQTPGVSGWYPVGGQATPVWTANVGTGEAGSNPYLYLWPVDERVDHPAAATFATEVRAIPAFAASKGKSPSARLVSLAASGADLKAFFAHIEVLVSTVPSADGVAGV